MIEQKLAELCPDFDAFLIDQFGVLLDGEGAYPHAPAALKRLAASGKEIILLSNSGRRSAPNEARLSRLGFARSDYRLVLSSGEAAHAAIARRIGNDIAAGAKVLVLSRENDLSGIEGLDLKVTNKAAEADLIVLAGSCGDTMGFGEYIELLQPAADRKIPCLCTNPDMVMLAGGSKTFGAGRIAREYQAMGGKVEWFGKPYPLIYQTAQSMLGNIPPERVLCIGDSPAHDVRGGRSMGYRTALVRTGIHENVPLQQLLSGLPPEELPDFVIAAFEL